MSSVFLLSPSSMKGSVSAMFSALTVMKFVVIRRYSLLVSELDITGPADKVVNEILLVEHPGLTAELEFKL